MKVILLVSLFCFVSCTISETNEEAENHIFLDNIHKNYVLSKDGTLSLNDRLQYINKAINLSQEIDSDSLKLRYKSYESTIYGSSKDYESAILSASDLLKQATDFNNDKYKALATKKLGRYFFKSKDYKNAYLNYSLSYEMYKLINDSIKLSEVLLSLAEIEKNEGLYKLSEENAVKGLTYLPENAHKRAPLYNLISINQREQGKPKESLIWADSAINANSEENKLYHSRNIKYLNSKALALRDDNRFEEASKIFSQLLKKNSPNYARYLSNHAYCNWKKDATLDVEKQLKESLKIRESTNDSIGLIASYKHLSDYFENKDEKLYRNYLNKLYTISKRKKALTEQIETLERIKDIELDVNKREEYLVEIIKLEKYRDKELERVEDGYAVIRFGTKLKDFKILTLEEVNQSLRYERYMYILLVIVTLLTTLFLIYYFHERKKKIQLKERYQTETRLSKKVHDEVGNDIFYLITQLENDPSLLEKNGLKLLDGLQNIYSKARDISREYTDIDTGDGFPEELLSLLNSFGNKEIKIITKQLAPTFWTSIGADLKSEVFRIVQELLTNMKKHSQASMAAVTFKKEARKLVIQYSDNGIGVGDEQQTLKSVENRIQVLQGVLTLDAQPDEGLQVSIIIPI